jgi:hypothetical protein
MGERISREERVKGLVRLVRYPRHAASGGSWTPAASSANHRSQAAIRLARRTCCSPVLRQSRLPGMITVAPEGRPNPSLPGPRPPGGLEGIAPASQRPPAPTGLRSAPASQRPPAPTGLRSAPASQRPPAPTGLRSEERATREGGAFKAAGGERDNRASGITELGLRPRGRAWAGRPAECGWWYRWHGRSAPRCPTPGRACRP